MWGTVERNIPHYYPTFAIPPHAVSPSLYVKVELEVICEQVTMIVLRFVFSLRFAFFSSTLSSQAASAI